MQCSMIVGAQVAAGRGQLHEGPAVPPPRDQDDEREEEELLVEEVSIDGLCGVY